MSKTEWELAKLELATNLADLDGDRPTKLAATSEYWAHSLDETGNPFQSDGSPARPVERIIKKPAFRMRIEGLAKKLMKLQKIES